VEIAPEFEMPPVNVENSPAPMPMSAETVPPLLMPPVKLETAPAAMPAPNESFAMIVPVLVTPAAA